MAIVSALLIMIVVAVSLSLLIVWFSKKSKHACTNSYLHNNTAVLTFYAAQGCMRHIEYMYVVSSSYFSVEAWLHHIIDNDKSTLQRIHS